MSAKHENTFGHILHILILEDIEDPVRLVYKRVVTRPKAL